jgi:hypothetical protein
MFGEMIHLTNTPAMHLPSSAIECQLHILPNKDSQVWGFEQPPQGTQHFDLDASIPRSTLV